MKYVKCALEVKLPFSKQNKRKSKHPLDIVHSDVCGPITPTAHDGKRYFLTFLDDFTHLAMVYLLESKDQVFEYFQDYVTRVSNVFCRNINVLKCDNGKEYVSKVFQSFCRTKGTEIQYTIPYTPEQNGAAERLNRTLLEKGRALILESNLSKEMWGEAILCATYLLNRSPTSALGTGTTPAELYYSEKPDLKNLERFLVVLYITRFLNRR